MDTASHAEPTLTLRETRDRLKDLFTPRALVYWTDLLASATVGWGGFAVAMQQAPWSAAHVVATVVSALALYRSAMFIHELTHLPKGSLPGFHTVWDLLVGVPLLLPSFMYLGVHLDHHRRNVYGTAGDPEYLPLARSSRVKTVLFLVQPVVIPLLLLARFAVLAPLSVLLGSKVRELIVTRASALVINPAYRRDLPTGALRGRWVVTELLASALVLGLLGAIVAGLVSWRVAGQWYLVSVLAAFVNQLRTVGAHRWRNAGGELDVIAQLVDSVNTPGGALTEIWAPVGLRWHGLHHFVPDMPYHSLGAAHRRLVSSLPSDSPYFQTVSPGIFASLATLWREAGEAGGRAVAEPGR